MVQPMVQEPPEALLGQDCIEGQVYTLACKGIVQDDRWVIERQNEIEMCSSLVEEELITGWIDVLAEVQD